MLLILLGLVLRCFVQNLEVYYCPYDTTLACEKYRSDLSSEASPGTFFKYLNGNWYAPLRAEKILSSPKITNSVAPSGQFLCGIQTYFSPHLKALSGVYCALDSTSSSIELVQQDDSLTSLVWTETKCPSGQLVDSILYGDLTDLDAIKFISISCRSIAYTGGVTATTKENVMVWDGVYGDWIYDGNFPSDYLACGGRLKVLGKMGAGDDVAVSRIQLNLCHRNNWSDQQIFMASNDSTSVGVWNSTVMCGTDKYIFKLKVQYEDPAGVGDKTEMNGLMAYCAYRDWTGYEEIEIHKGFWGSWKNYSSTPDRYYFVSGFAQKEEVGCIDNDCKGATGMRVDLTKYGQESYPDYGSIRVFRSIKQTGIGTMQKYSARVSSKGAFVTNLMVHQNPTTAYEKQLHARFAQTPACTGRPTSRNSRNETSRFSFVHVFVNQTDSILTPHTYVSGSNLACKFTTTFQFYDCSTQSTDGYTIPTGVSIGTDGYTIPRLMTSGHGLQPTILCYEMQHLSYYWAAPEVYTDNYMIKYKVCANQFQLSQMDPFKATTFGQKLTKNEKKTHDIQVFNMVNPDTEFCVTQNYSIYTYDGANFNPYTSTTVTYSGGMVQVDGSTPVKRDFFIVLQSYGQNIDYMRMPVLVCGNETGTFLTSVAVEIYLDYDPAGPFLMTNIVHDQVDIISEDPWCITGYDNVNNGVKLYSEYSSSTKVLFTDTTKVQITHDSAAATGHGYTVKILRDSIWGQTIPIVAALTTKGLNIFAKKYTFIIGENCFNVVYKTQNSHNLPYPKLRNQETIQMVVPLIAQDAASVFQSLNISEQNIITIENGEKCPYQDVTVNHGTDIRSNLDRAIAMSGDKSVFSNPFITDFNNDPRMNQLSVKADVGGVSEVEFTINNKNITQKIILCVLVCGKQTLSYSPLVQSNYRWGYKRALRLYDTDPVFQVPQTVVIDLDTLFVMDEDSAYRDAYGFLEEGVCTDIYYQMCLDELCTANYSSANNITFTDYDGDGWTTELVISTAQGFVGEMFWVKAFNKAILQEKILYFELDICGSEVISYASNTTFNYTLDPTTYGSILKYNVTSFFSNTQFFRCPFTSLEITGISSFEPIDNSLMFFIGQNDTKIQAIDKQMEYMDRLIQLDNSDPLNAFLSVNTSVLNDTSLNNFTLNLTAQTDSNLPITVTVNFNFSRIIREKLNVAPTSLVLFSPLYRIPVNFDLKLTENKTFSFTFEDANQHLMNISLWGNKTMLKFTSFERLLQEGTKKNYTINVMMGKVTYQDLGKYELNFEVSDVYITVEFPTFIIELYDVTPLPESPPVPELSPFFLTSVEPITATYTINATEQVPVMYILPEAFDYNFDKFHFEFVASLWDPWSHVLAYDGQSTVTVNPGALTETDISVLRESTNLDQQVVIIDAKGYSSAAYTLTISIQIVEPEQEEEQEEEEDEKTKNTNQGQGGFGFVPDWDKFYADQNKGKGGTVEEEIVQEEVKVEKVFDPALIAQIQDITTLGLVTIQFGDGFYPPKADSFEIISQKMQFVVVPQENENIDASKLQFVWEIIEFDESSGQMLVQVNFTNAIWISASNVPDELELELIDFKYFIPEEQSRRLQELNLTQEEVKNYSCSAGISRQMPNTEASQSYDESTEQMTFLMVITTIYTMILSVFLASAIQKLLISLFSLQVIIHMFFFTIPFPGNIINVIKKIKPLASLNIMKELSKYVEKAFTFDTLGQISLKPLILPTARNMGVNHMNCIVNLKQIFLLIIAYLLKVCYTLVLRTSPQCTARYTNMSKQVFFGGMIAITQAGFIPITIACFLQLSYPLSTNFAEKFGYFIGVITALMTFFVYPIFLMGVMLSNKDTLMLPEVKMRFGAIYNGQKIDTFGQRAYRLVFQLRRWAVLYVAFFWYHNPIFQIIAMNMINLLILIYHGVSEPFATAQGRKMDYFNEGCLALITYFLFMYNDNIPDEDLKYTIGWAQVVVFGFNIAFNSYGVVVKMIKDTYLLIKKLAIKFISRFSNKAKQSKPLESNPKVTKQEAQIILDASSKSKKSSMKKITRMLSIIEEEDSIIETERSIRGQGSASRMVVTLENAYRRRKANEPIQVAPQMDEFEEFESVIRDLDQKYGK